jgi:AmmeMemoRadiSam system protein B
MTFISCFSHDPCKDSFPNPVIIEQGEKLVRRPAVAGQFYSDDKSRLISEIKRCFESPIGPGDSAPPASKKKRSTVGAVSPHAGYVYSGPVAAHLYRRLWGQEPPKTVVIMGPNHTGFGAGVAITSEAFQTPLGTVKTDGQLIGNLVDDLIIEDAAAHAYEHSLEVQIPFMQYIGWDPLIVPICIGAQDFETLTAVGEKLRSAVSGRNDVLMIASSDMSHYVPPKVAKELDMKAIDCILAMDSRRLYQTIITKNITMCGFAPTIVMMEALKGSKAELLKYATSGDVRPMNEVVGYAAVSLER